MSPETFLELARLRILHDLWTVRTAQRRLPSIAWAFDPEFSYHLEALDAILELTGAEAA
jgi:hypothetical protein